MNLSFQPRSLRRARPAEPATFRVDRLWSHEADRSTEISHLIDRTYDYASVRELRWHLAARFARPVTDLALARI
jgi:hypothetical protein